MVWKDGVGLERGLSTGGGPYRSDSTRGDGGEGKWRVMEGNGGDGGEWRTMTETDSG